MGSLPSKIESKSSEVSPQCRSPFEKNLTLYASAQEGNLVKFNEAFEGGADIEYKNSEDIDKFGYIENLGYGNTSLHIACLRGFMPMITRLVELNANINTINSNGLTPLQNL